MYAAASPALHDHGFADLLDIVVRVAEPRCVVVEARLSEAAAAGAGPVPGGLVTALADSAIFRGAALNARPGVMPASIETRTSFLQAGRGAGLLARATPLHLGSPISVWRAAVLRDGAQIADVTQTILADTRADDASPGVAAPREPAPGPAAAAAVATGSGPALARTRLSRSFSQTVVDDRWQRIFDAACDVIARKGFAKATIREIAEAAGMPVPTMYQYLEHKEDLLFRIYEYFMSDIVEALKAWRTSQAPAAERLEGAIRTTIEVFDRHHRLIKLMFQETRALTPAARSRVYELDASYIAIFRELVAGISREGGRTVHDAELQANLIYFLCTVWPLRYWTIGKHGRERVTDEVARFALQGLGLERTAPRRVQRAARSPRRAAG